MDHPNLGKRKASRARPSPGPWLAAGIALAGAAAGAPSTAFGTAPPPTPAAHAGKPEVLTLEQAIRRAISRGFTMEQARLALRSAELNYQNAWDTMYLPTLALNFNSLQSLTLSHLAGSGNGPGDDHGYPTTGLNLSLGSYTLFNFQKDWLAFEPQRLNYLRQKEIFDEVTRQTRFDTTKSFYQARNALEKLDASQRSVDIAQAIRDLQASRVHLGRASANDVSSSDLDLANAKNDRDSSETLLKTTLWDLNHRLLDPIGTQYEIRDSSKNRFRPLKLTLEQALHLYEERAPSLKNSLLQVKNSELSLELQQKNRLPLPKIALSGVTVGYNGQYYGSKPAVTTTSTTPTNFDVSAALTFSVPIVGQGGLFGARTAEIAEVALDQSEANLRDQKVRDQIQILTLIQTIQQSEKIIVNNQVALTNASQLLDTLFQKVSGGAGQVRLELRDAIQQARNADLNYNDSVTQHLNSKLDLAAFLGVDKLPGE